ncbi:MAG: hypothetical protein NW203_13595 [Hyphomonadaceae bacterium]|nr:hypothetical protein [Hyphomonadaceae bacterium]
MTDAQRRNLLQAGLGLPFTSAAHAQTGAARPQPYRAPRPPRAALLDKPPGTAWWAPRPPAYPNTLSDERLLRDARGYSDALLAYIDAWFDGRVGAVLPDAFVPPGVNRRDFPRFTLQRAEEIDPDVQWVVRPSHVINPNALYGSFPDPNCTYLLGMLYAPFGATLTVEGEFPHARFFSAQITPSFDPKSYRYDGGIGVPEAPMVDVDITPLPGHVNPFQIGARRDATQRSYRLEFDLAIGDRVAANQALRPPYFRQTGNRRIGGALFHQGPWGAWPNIGGHGRGAWDIGQIWLRYYRPDDAVGRLGGVALPRMTYRLPDGRAFWMHIDAAGLNARANRTVRLRPASAEPTEWEHTTSRYGWAKQVGIFRGVISGFAMNTNGGTPAYVRALDKGVAGRGHDLPPPNNYEQSATSCAHIDYLARSATCAAGKVVVLTGRLPTTPRTRAGAPTMSGAEARYWSIVGYYIPDGWDFLAAFAPNAVNGVAQHAVMDEEVVLQEDRRYVIALSRAQDRPTNARAEAGVTWVDWGAAPKVSWTLRWLTVGPEWTAPNAPTPAKVGPHGDWAHPDFDADRMWRNNRGTGLLGAYQPRVHYLTRAAFEALGPRVRWSDVPAWEA